ncbi:MAG TPA: hypothetical protein VJA16_09830 [Thermoanaerobaculia bacterium]
MYQRRAQVCPAVLLSSLLILAACRPHQGVSAMPQWEEFRDATDTRVFTLPLTDERQRVSLRAKLTLERGGATVRLLDPAGNARWEKSFGPGESSADQSFASDPGTWRVELRLTGATGRARILLVAT